MIQFSKQFYIDGRQVGEMHPVYIIAEAGVAHFGVEEKAYKLVDLAVDAGADAVKFQIFDVDALISEASREWKDRLKSRQLPFDAFKKIQSYCKNKGITFFATAHDEPSLEFLADLDVPVYKIGSGEVGNWPYFSKIASLGKPLIFSTGMYQIQQIEEALTVISAQGNPDVAVLHCVTQYPTPPSEVSLGNIKLIRNRYSVVSGYSDHTQGFHIPLASVAFGASVIEKHISLDFNVPDAQDWKVSCGPHDLADFIRQVREIESAEGIRESGPTDGEKDSLAWARKSLVAARNINAGERLVKDDILSKRPGTGISPEQIGKIIGRVALKPVLKDSLFKFEDLE